MSIPSRETPRRNSTEIRSLPSPVAPARTDLALSRSLSQPASGLILHDVMGSKAQDHARLAAGACADRYCCAADELRRTFITYYYLKELQPTRPLQIPSPYRTEMQLIMTIIPQLSADACNGAYLYFCGVFRSACTAATN